ncbi:UNVERIFIED_CONTAM: hypothetical protein I5919_19045 [Aeromonas hydrophila]
MAYRQPSCGLITDLIIESTDLEVFFGEGEWTVRKHGAELLPTLLNRLQPKLECVYTDRAYDSKTNHQLIACKGATNLYPTRQERGAMEKGTPTDVAQRK